MKHFLRSTFTTAAILLFPLVLLAQPGGQRPNMPSPEEYAQNMVTSLSEKIELTDVQKDSLTTTFKSFRETLASAMQNRDTARQKMEEATKKRDKAVEAILGDKAKYKTYQKFIEQQQPMGRPGGARGNGPGRN